MPSKVMCRIARDAGEIQAARELIFKSFGPSYFDIRETKTFEAQIAPEQHNLINYVVAIDHDQIVGVLRYYPQEVVIGDIPCTLATLAEFCVDPSATRSFVGIELVKASIDVIRDKGFVLCWGSARRAMDDYYTRMGFSGVGGYCRIVIEKYRGRVSPIPFEATSFAREHIGAYSEAYRLTYGNLWCYFSRGEADWFRIEERARKGMEYRFAELHRSTQIAGYVIWKGDSIVEFALSRSVECGDMKAAIDALRESYGTSILTIALSFYHPCMKAMQDYHIALQYRRVPDAGQIAKVLNRQRFLALMGKVFTRQFNREKVPAFNLSGQGLTVEWDGGEARCIVSNNPPAPLDRVLLTLLFQGVDPIDSAVLGDPVWVSRFPRRYFNWSAVDNG